MWTFMAMFMRVALTLWYEKHWLSAGILRVLQEKARCQVKFTHRSSLRPRWSGLMKSLLGLNFVSRRWMLSMFELLVCYTGNVLPRLSGLMSFDVSFRTELCIRKTHVIYVWASNLLHGKHFSWLILQFLVANG